MERNYKEKTINMSSDIGMVSIRFCGENGVEFKNIHFGTDGYYNVYVNENLEEIPSHYATSKNQGSIDKVYWFDVLDDCDIKRCCQYGKLNWYVAGKSLLINIVK